MSYRAVLGLAGLVSLAFGLALVLAARWMMALYAVHLTSGAVVVTHLLGASLLGFTALAWYGRSVTDAGGRRAVVMANLVGDSLGFALALRGQLSGDIGQLGWSTVAIYLVLALAFGYLQFVRPAANA